MSITLNIQTNRKKGLEKLLKAIAEFWGGCPNERVSVNLTLEALE